MDKESIRKQIKEKLGQLSPELREAYNEELLHSLKNSAEWRSAHSIAITLSSASEVNTEAVIQAAWSEGKDVVIPYSGKKRTLSFYSYTKETELERSAFGILEPKNRCQEVPKEHIDLVVVPGLAYSDDGYRVGFGGGYYDRYLADYPGKTISLLYPFQLQPRVAEIKESFDIPIQKLFIATK